MGLGMVARGKGGMKKFSWILILVGLVFSSMGWATTPAALQAGEEWHRLGMRLQTFTQLPKIKTGQCMNRFDDFVACFESLQFLLSQAPQPLFLTPSLMFEDPRRGEIAKTFGSFTITKLNSVGQPLQSLREHYEASSRIARVRGEHLQKIYEDARERSSPFRLLFPFAFSQLQGLHPFRQAELGALAMETFHQATDPHAKMETKAEKARRMQLSSERYVGVGLVLRAFEGRLLIQSVFAQGPAARAGVRMFDELVRLNGQPVKVHQLQEISRGLRGDVGTLVQIQVRRAGNLHNFELTRENLVHSNLQHEFVERDGKKLALLKIRSFFDEKLCDSLGEVLSEAESQRVDGFMLDLRGNPGGLLSQAICVGSLFLGRKVIVKTRALRGEKVKTWRGTRQQKTAKPLVVLINQESGSASEVLAGALQDHRRAFLVGLRSFGKGSVQYPMDLPHGLGLQQEATFWRTRELYSLPGGRVIHKLGLEPDVRISQNLAAASEVFFLREAELYPQGPGAMSSTSISERASSLVEFENTILSQFRAQHRREPAQRDYQLEAGFQTLLTFIRSPRIFGMQSPTLRSQSLRCDQLI